MVWVLILVVDLVCVWFAVLICFMFGCWLRFAGSVACWLRFVGLWFELWFECSFYGLIVLRGGTML